MTKTTTAKPAVIRIDTAHYGVILSTHRTAEAADKACERKCAALTRANRDAIANLVYTTAEVVGSKGDRVRYA